MGRKDKGRNSNRTNTTLPKALKDELVSLGKLTPTTSKRPNRNFNNRRRPPQDQRKSQQEKQKGNGFEGSTKTQKRPLENEDHDIENGHEQKKPKQTSTKKKSNEKTALEKLVDKAEGKGKSKSTSESNSSSKTKNSNKDKDRSQVEIQEDQEIAWLENQLGVNRSGKKAKNEFEMDGIDDLMGDLDKIYDPTQGSSDEEEEENQQEEDIENDMEVDLNEDEDEDETEDDEEELEEDGYDEEKEDVQETEIIEKKNGKVKTETDTIAENGETPSTSAKPSRYVPPQRRAVESPAASIQNTRLQRILHRHVNKLSSPNIAPTLTEIEKVYLEHPRAIASTVLIEQLIKIICSRDSLAASFIVTYATLVSLMCRIVGKEFGNAILARAIYQYDNNPQTANPSLSNLLSVEGGSGPESKQRLNIVSFLCELYNLQVIGSQVMYDLIKEIIQKSSLDEESISFLLGIIEGSGSQLRHDDPTSLKEIIKMVTEKQKSIPADQISTRATFMIEQLSNLRANRMKETSSSAADIRNSLKKFITHTSKQRSLSASEPITTSLESIRERAATGQWWNVSLQNNEQIASEKKTQKEIALKSLKEEEKMLKLARSHGMNTDIRRSIFANLMSAEDCMDARERIVGLGLNDVQKRDIIRVILHCSEMERTFNPYYPLVIEQIIKSSNAYGRSLQITLQFCLWDFFRSLGEEGVGGHREDVGFEQNNVSLKRKVRNLSQTYAWCVVKVGLSLNILKPLQFQILQSSTESFVKQFLNHVINYTQCNTPIATSLNKKGTMISRQSAMVSIKEIFTKAQDVAALPEGLLFFIQNKMGLSGLDNDDEEEEQDQSLNEENWGLFVAYKTLRSLTT